MIPKELLEEPKVVASYNDRIRDIISKMQENNQWVVPVVREKSVIGVISYNELLRRKVSPESKVINLMTPSNNVLDSDDETKIVAKFFTTKSRALIVIDNKKRLVGIITREGLLSYYLNKGEIPNAKVREVMASPVISINSNDSVARARWLMSNNHISKLPVLEEKKLVGILSTRDIVNRLYSEGGKKKSSILTEEERLMALPVREIMNYPVITTNGSQSVIDAIETLLKKKISGMPVIEGDMVVGMFSGIDVVNLIAKKFELEMPIEAKLSGELKQGDTKALIDGILERYLSRLQKLTEVINFKVTFKEVAKSQDKKMYQVTARAVTKIGDFISKDTDWDPVTAVRKTVEKLEERVTRELKRIETKGRKPKAEED